MNKKWTPYAKKASLFFEQILVTFFKHFTKCDKFDVGDETLSRFDTLYRVFVDVVTYQLKFFGEFAFGELHFLAKFKNPFSADIVSFIWSFIDKHAQILLFDIHCLTTI